MSFPRVPSRKSEIPIGVIQRQDGLHPGQSSHRNMRGTAGLAVSVSHNVLPDAKMIFKSKPIVSRQPLNVPLRLRPQGTFRNLSINSGNLTAYNTLFSLGNIRQTDLQNKSIQVNYDDQNKAKESGAISV